MKTKIVSSFKESNLTGRLKVKLNTPSSHVVIDPDVERTVLGHPVNYYMIEVQPDDGEAYTSMVIETADGVLYRTTSRSFIETAEEVIANMDGDPDDGETYEIAAIGRESKTRSGKNYLICVLL